MRRLALALVLASVLPAQGCLAVAAGALGAGYYQFKRNELWRDFPIDFERAHQATLVALEGLGYGEPQVQWLGASEGELEDGDLRIRLERYAGGTTRVRVRHGTFDSEDNARRSAVVLDAIARRIGA